MKDLYNIYLNINNVNAIFSLKARNVNKYSLVG